MVSEILIRIGQVEMSSASVWRVTQAAGERFQALEKRERERANCLPERWEPPSRAEVKDQRMGVAMDGAIIPIRDEGWKEMKIGNIFDIAISAHKDRESGEIVELAHAVNNSYVAHLGGPDPLGELTWAEARRCGWEEAQDTIVIHMVEIAFQELALNRIQVVLLVGIGSSTLIYWIAGDFMRLNTGRLLALTVLILAAGV